MGRLLVDGPEPAEYAKVREGLGRYRLLHVLNPARVILGNLGNDPKRVLHAPKVVPVGVDLRLLQVPLPYVVSDELDYLILQCMGLVEYRDGPLQILAEQRLAELYNLKVRRIVPEGVGREQSPVLLHIVRARLGGAVVFFHLLDRGLELACVYDLLAIDRLFYNAAPFLARHPVARRVHLVVHLLFGHYLVAGKVRLALDGAEKRKVLHVLVLEVF